MEPLYVLLIAFVIILLWNFIQAWRFGVLLQIAWSIGLALGLWVFYTVCRGLPEVMEALNLSFVLNWAWMLGIACGAAVLVTYLFRLGCYWIQRRLYGYDMGGTMMNGGPCGALISIFPTLLVFACLLFMLRMAGTLTELKWYSQEAVRVQNAEESRAEPFPYLARMRDEVESNQSWVRFADSIDPFGNRANRNAAGLLLLLRSTRLERYLLSEDKIAAIDRVADLDRIANRPTIRQSLAGGYLMNVAFRPEVWDEAQDASVRHLFRDLRLRMHLEARGM